jgi:hypothetical protein
VRSAVFRRFRAAMSDFRPTGYIFAQASHLHFIRCETIEALRATGEEEGLFSAVNSKDVIYSLLIITVLYLIIFQSIIFQIFIKYLEVSIFS